MPALRGTVVIAQEGRLHVIDDAGAGRLFILRARAAAETEQLAPSLSAGLIAMAGFAIAATGFFAANRRPA